MKNKRNVNWLRMGYWIFFSIIAVFLLVRTAQHFQLFSPKDNLIDKPPVQIIIPDDPVTFSTHVEVQTEEAFKVLLGDIDITVPGTAATLKPGVYQLKVLAEDGRELYVDHVLVDPTTNELKKTITVTPQKKSITIHTGMDNCEFFLDGKFAHPFDQETQILLPYGTYTFEVRAEGYQPKQVLFTIDEDSSYDLSMDLLPQS
jgi:hypothetical protein